jgi:hypothetical protein
MERKRISKRQALALLDRCRRESWKLRTERIACACETGDSGWRETYNNGERDILAIEYPKARYRVRAYALV